MRLESDGGNVAKFPLFGRPLSVMRASDAARTTSSGKRRSAVAAVTPEAEACRLTAIVTKLNEYARTEIVQLILIKSATGLLSNDAY